MWVGSDCTQQLVARCAWQQYQRLIRVSTGRDTNPADLLHLHCCASSQALLLNRCCCLRTSQHPSKQGRTSCPPYTTCCLRR